MGTEFLWVNTAGRLNCLRAPGTLKTSVRKGRDEHTKSQENHENGEKIVSTKKSDS